MTEHKVSNNQLEELLEYLASHPSLAKGVGLGARSRETIEKEWINLGQKLNSHGSGASKSGQRWKLYWIDLKHKVKSRAASRSREASATGGGPAGEALSETDNKILNIIGEGAVYGDAQHRIPVFKDHQRASKKPNIEEIDSVQGDSDAVETFSIDQESMELLHGSGRNENQDLEQQQSEVEEVQKINKQDAEARQCTSQKKSQPPLTKKRKIEPNWVIELETKRVEAEEKHSNAAMMLAEAALISANAAKMQAEAARLQAEAINTQTTCLLKLLELLKR